MNINELISALRDYNRFDTDNLIDLALIELVRLNEIVNHLQTTNDGVPIYPGKVVWIIATGGFVAPRNVWSVTPDGAEVMVGKVKATLMHKKFSELYSHG